MYEKCLNTFRSPTETVHGSVHSALVTLGRGLSKQDPISVADLHSDQQ